MIPDQFDEGYVHRNEKLVYDDDEKGLGVDGHFLAKLVGVILITLMIV